MRSKLACLTTLAFLLGACGDDGDPSTTTDATATETDASATMTDPTTSMTDASATMTDASATMTDATMTDPSVTMTDTDPTGTTDPTDATEDTGPDPDTTGGGACPPEDGDDECSTCTKTNCCPELMACEANADCDCVVQCISDMGIAMQQACLDKCMVMEPPPETAPLQTCVVTAGCLMACA